MYDHRRAAHTGDHAAALEVGLWAGGVALIGPIVMTHFLMNVSGKALLRIISNALEKAGLKREMRLAQEKLAEMSVRDELTGMFNRRYFQEALEQGRSLDLDELTNQLCQGRAGF